MKIERWFGSPVILQNAHMAIRCNTDGVHSGRGRLATIMVGKAMARVKVQVLGCWAVAGSIVCLFICLLVCEIPKHGDFLRPLVAGWQ